MLISNTAVINVSVVFKIIFEILLLWNQQKTSSSNNLLVSHTEIPFLFHFHFFWIYIYFTQFTVGLPTVKHGENFHTLLNTTVTISILLLLLNLQQTFFFPLNLLLIKYGKEIMQSRVNETSFVTSEI